MLDGHIVFGSIDSPFLTKPTQRFGKLSIGIISSSLNLIFLTATSFESDKRLL